ncbi:DUF1801 domain-containing protein [Rhodococcus hoagii]|nr:DUF1801 domain-containing protein [Prescottella equi]
MAAANKTHATDSSVDAFIENLPNPTRRADARRLRSIMEDESGEPAVMWGTSIVGFGSRTYRYASGRTGETPLVGYSPRATALSLYLTLECDELSEELDRLGPHRLGKGCLYITRLALVDEATLVELIGRSVTAARRLDHF